MRYKLQQRVCVTETTTWSDSFADETTDEAAREITGEAAGDFSTLFHFEKHEFRISGTREAGDFTLFPKQDI